jgi:adenylate cyclase class 2
MYEVEVKARLKNRQEVVKKLEALGCKFGEVLHQIDHVYFPESLTFPPPIGTGILRVRNQGDKYFFTLKISQSGRQDSIEREIEIKDGEMMMEIIKLIKYQEAPTVDKKRTKTKYKDMVIELDEVKDLGEFIEVEKIVTHENPEDRKKIQQELAGFIETLGVAKEDLLVNGKYDIMLFEKNNK